MKKKFLLYGANGYTGRLVAEYAREYDLIPVLSGRNEKELSHMANETGYDYVVVDLDDDERLQHVLNDFDVVLHCAGPFKYTYEKMANACLDTQTHYLDITGEIAVFKALHEMDSEAKSRGIMLLPGIGFDVVPTDSMAAYLSSKMPDAVKLELAFMAGQGISRGTMNTAIEGFSEGGMIRENGKLKRVKSAYKVKEIDYGKGPVLSATIPWGDVYTAYYSTGIPNIEVYMAGSKSLIRMQKWSRYFAWMMAFTPIKSLIKSRIKKGSTGPSEEQRKQNVSRVWGKVTDANDQSKTAILQTVDGYTLTAKTSLMAVAKILEGDFKSGFQTPSSVYGAEFVLELEGTTMNEHN